MLPKINTFYIAINPSLPDGNNENYSVDINDIVFVKEIKKLDYEYGRHHIYIHNTTKNLQDRWLHNGEDFPVKHSPTNSNFFSFFKEI